MMTLLVIALAAYLAFRAGDRTVAAATEVGYPTSAATPTGRQRIALLSAGATFALIVLPWLAIVEA